MAENDKAIATMSMVESHSSVMIVCRCGDVFRASGASQTVRRKQDRWTAKHANCEEQKREGRKVFWMSFCDGARPKGQQFLGACLMEVTAAEADAAAIEVLLRFPFAQPGAEWIAAATRKAHRLGCNPGGEIATVEIETDNPNLTHYQFGVLMDRATIERLDLKSAMTKPEGGLRGDPVGGRPMIVGPRDK